MSNIKSTTTNNNANNTTKYNVNVNGLHVIIASSNIQMDVTHLTTYLESNITSTVRTNESIFGLSFSVDNQQWRFGNHPSPDIMNCYFTDMMVSIAFLLERYELEYHYESQNMDDSLTRANLNLSPSALSSQSVFKSPSRKETKFDLYWKEQFDNLKEFKIQHGHTNVSRTTPGYSQLGNWLTDQRRKYRSGKLTKIQYDMLTEIGMYV